MSARVMDLADLLAGIAPVGAGTQVRGLACDSRRVRPGSLFLACRGARGHGLDHLQEALAAGASAVAWEPAGAVAAPVLPAGVTGVAVPALSSRLAELANRYYASPSARLALAGVTGTNGKTTTAWLVAQALARLGADAAYLGTLGYGRLGSLADSDLTTPDCVEFNRRLDELAAAGVTHAVSEVSSHALDQGRVDGLRFAVAALTNLSRDHLDYHGSLEAYAAAKARLFVDCRPARMVINVGDEFGRELLARLPTGADALTVALLDTAGGDRPARLEGRLLAAHRDGLGLAIDGDFGRAQLASPLWGRHNAENLVVALGILLAIDYPLARAAAALATAVAPPGRLQRLTAAPDRPAVFVDFAHTPAALRSALSAIREHCAGQVWCVFGCGGERDRGKRAEMAAVAERLADRVVVTDDNPRGEDPARIVADILAGFSNGAGVDVLRDRGAAIARAIGSAAAGDAVLIAGKGHETRQLQASGSREFSDARAALAALGQVE
ncbi:MAG: UDP-N-acetylmuramoyl-L-alanyl-D-glutamate--2,6-diaminopimelate ligase [Gammaproteobacteria bacterium]|nr:MAG: UDP-N-acetylmuramoyl-L-alanyl-D-glutamate--2,6-diaminopimelate ligase [Gammaproteobacteria bacterium]